MSEAETVRVQPNQKRIRGVVDGHVVVDTRSSVFVWEHRYYPQWYIPVEDVDGRLEPNGTTFESEGRGEGHRVDLVTDTSTRRDVGWVHPDSPVAGLRSRVRFDFDAFDAWFEEDVEVFVHPRSPEVRIDALASSSHVVVSVDGVQLANSTRPTILFETGLPPRYYLPKSDVRMDLLAPSDAETACPYKGWASYWNVTVGDTVHDGLAWGYRTPLPESAAIAGLVCFYNEKVDITVDDEPIGRPDTVFK